MLNAKPEQNLQKSTALITQPSRWWGGNESEVSMKSHAIKTFRCGVSTRDSRQHGRGTSKVFDKPKIFAFPFSACGGRSRRKINKIKGLWKNFIYFFPHTFLSVAGSSSPVVCPRCAEVSEKGERKVLFDKQPRIAHCVGNLFQIIATFSAEFPILQVVVVNGLWFSLSSRLSLPLSYMSWKKGCRTARQRGGVKWKLLIRPQGGSRRERGATTENTEKMSLYEA